MGLDTGLMDTNVISLSAHRAVTQSLPKTGVKLIVITSRGHLSIALARQDRIARARRASTMAQTSAFKA